MRAVTLTSPTTVTVATRSPARTEGSARGSWTLRSSSSVGVAHAPGRLVGVGRDRAQPGHRVAQQDQQGVADEGHLGRGDREEAGNGASDRHEGHRGDDVEQASEAHQRRAQGRHPPRRDAEGQRDGQADANGDRGELDVLDQQGGDQVPDCEETQLHWSSGPAEADERHSRHDPTELHGTSSYPPKFWGA